MGRDCGAEVTFRVVFCDAARFSVARASRAT